MCFDYDYIIRPTRKTLLDALKQVGKNDWEAVHFTEECHGHAIKYGVWVRRKIPDLPATSEPPADEELRAPGDGSFIGEMPSSPVPVPPLPNPSDVPLPGDEFQLTPLPE